MLYLLLGWLVISALAGAYVAAEAGRPAAEGVIFGLLFGPLGLIVVALLPEKTKPAIADRSRARGDINVDASKWDTRDLTGLNVR